MSPRVSIIMSAYNEAAHIAQAIDSILAQTFTDFEFIIINDGSTDQTKNIIAGYKDKRIRAVERANAGLVASLNLGVQMAKAQLIARQDADDASLPNRLEQLVALFDADKNLVLAGTSMQTMDSKGNYLHDHVVLLGNRELKQELLVRSPFAHGSVMFKKDIFEQAGGYLQAEWPAEDYGLWLRMAPFGNFANIDEPLYSYRENQDGISQNNAEQQANMTTAIRNKAWQQRQQLVPLHISIKPYVNLVMWHERLERIARNVLITGRHALSSGDLLTLARTTWLLFTSGWLLRKAARVLLIKLRFRHV